MDHFIRINEMSDAAAAEAIRAAEIDVLIDLQGLTGGCRPNILAYRPAPVQITWLGFPGPTGLPGIDYVLSDKYVIPEETARYYTEKPLYMPECYQVNDRKRVSSPPLSRKEYQLPEDAFVFCAFNNNIKFTPEFFSAWMRILNRVPHSVLWLLADNERAKANLLRYAEEQGVTADRLVFAPRVPVADYLGRFVTADLFLDLSPFNGGTTAADALWMGLPLITCSGRSFASRMAGSLLLSIGLPELITTSLSDYENLAVRLANDQAMLSAIKSRLATNKASSSVFDTPRFVKNLEDLLSRVAVRA
jgi:predicted O-linked N-acetylglucosamine transferase (SPINDLY family)